MQGDQIDFSVAFWRQGGQIGYSTRKLRQNGQRYNSKGHIRRGRVTNYSGEWRHDSQLLCGEWRQGCQILCKEWRQGGQLLCGEWRLSGQPACGEWGQNGQVDFSVGACSFFVPKKILNNSIVILLIAHLVPSFVPLDNFSQL
jgi:hypothetical protein